jgi:hypothetical protein
MNKTSASRTSNATAPRIPPNREVKATFLGYQAAGKSTLLTAALLASRLGRLRSSTSGRALGVTEKLLEGEESFFTHPLDDERGLSRIDLLRRGAYVPKTEQEWLRIHLALEFAGKTPVDCTTSDYTGELAAIRKMSKSELQLQEHVKRSDCLYLFFDASLHRGQDQDELAAWRHQGQGEAILRAYQTFTEARPGWPIVIVVTKADLLFAGRSPGDVTAEIEELNGRSARAIEQGRQVFRDFLRRQGALSLADVLLANRRRACVRVCFVAALGAAPRQIRGSEGQSAFGIARLQDWVPLGIAETLETGMYAAIRKQQQQDLARTAFRGLPYAAAVALLAVMVLSGIDRDRRAVAAIERQVADFDMKPGAIQAGTVLDRARQALSIRHPFVFLAERPIPFGAFPDWVDAEQVRAIERRFTLLALADRLERLRAETGDLSALLRRQGDFTAMMDKLRGQELKWQALAGDIEATRERFEQLPGGAGDVARLSGGFDPARADFLVQAIDAVWRLAKAQGIAVAAAGEQVKPYVSSLKQLQVASMGVGQTQLDAGLGADDRGRCDLLFDQYQRITVQSPGQRDAQFASLAEACRTCAEETLRPELCADLANAGERWDFEEAKQLYQDLSRLTGPQGVTPELVRGVENYLQHTRERQSRVSDHAPAYKDTAEAFMYWHQLLARTYRLDGIQVSIKDAAPFIRIDRTSYDCGSGYDSETCYRYNSVTPSGTLTLVVGGQTVARASYATFSPRLPVDSLYWEPGWPIELRITNDASGQSTTLVDGSAYALLNIAGSGLGNAIASARFQDLDIPRLPFDPKALVPPDPPTAGRR